MIVRKAVAAAVAAAFGSNNHAKILILDIETAPNAGFVWGLWKQNVGLNQLISEWYILSWCAKWLGQNKAVYMDGRGQKDVSNDVHMLQELWYMLNNADIVVAHNAVRFDVKKINARFFAAGMNPPSPYKIVDTLLIAKAKFAFTSNKLEYLTKKFNKCYTKLSHGKYPGQELWTQVMLDNLDAWHEMQEYNVYDVYALEELYIKLRTWDDRHPNVNVYVADETVRCVVCGSDDLSSRGYYHTNSGKYNRLRCNHCGKWNRTRYTINTTEKRKSLLT